MIASYPIASSLSSQFSAAPSKLRHLLAAAVVNPQFQHLLLEDPKRALQSGYLGNTFDLSLEERERILSAQAHSLAELVKKLATA